MEREEYSSPKARLFLTNVVKQIKPIKIYNNFKVDKDQIKKDQKGKKGVYCLVNLINGHIYIGSSVNLAVSASPLRPQII